MACSPKGRNAIDGIFENSAHGEYPYQSWGINRDPNAALTLDFGREVLLDELRITERADFPHDNYWVKATVEFSDGSTLDIPLVKSAKPQSVLVIAVKGQIPPARAWPLSPSGCAALC